MKKEISLISNFNLDIYYNFLNKKIDNKKYKLIKPNFGLFYEKCFEMVESKKSNYIIFIWSQIEGVLKNFKALIENENINIKALYKEVDEYTNILNQLAKKTDHLIVNSWSLPENERGKYLSDYTSEMGLSKNINLINSRVSNQLKNKTFVFTGKLKNISRAEAKSLTEKNSGKIISNVTKKLNYLVIGEKPTTKKIKEAKELKVKVIIQSEWQKLLN